MPLSSFIVYLPFLTQQYTDFCDQFLKKTFEQLTEYILEKIIISSKLPLMQ